MKKYQSFAIEWFLRVSLSFGFLSAVMDRFGYWPKETSVWGNWTSFVKYTHTLLPFISEKQALFAAIIANFLEILLGIVLLLNFKTALFAKISGFLLLIFAFSMAFFVSAKAPLDYSVFTASAAAFALSSICKKN